MTKQEPIGPYPMPEPGEMQPTCEMRFVERDWHHETEDKILAGRARILQQRWTDGERSEWIDVPLVSP